MKNENAIKENATEKEEDANKKENAIRKGKRK